jgi:hypothetical protein
LDEQFISITTYNKLSNSSRGISIDTPGNSTKKPMMPVLMQLIGIIFIILIPIAAFVAILLRSSIELIGFMAILTASLLIVCGYYHLVYVIPRMSKDVEARVSMEALKASFWIIMFGLIIIVLVIVLSFLFLMGFVPWI